MRGVGFRAGQHVHRGPTRLDAEHRTGAQVDAATLLGGAVLEHDPEVDDTVAAPGQRPRVGDRDTGIAEQILPPLRGDGRRNVDLLDGPRRVVHQRDLVLGAELRRRRGGAAVEAELMRAAEVEAPALLAAGVAIDDLGIEQALAGPPQVQAKRIAALEGAVAEAIGAPLIRGERRDVELVDRLMALVSTVTSRSPPGSSWAERAGVAARAVHNMPTATHHPADAPP